MTLALLLAAVLPQGAWTVTPPAPTVGDTIVLERFVPAATGTRGRTARLQASDVIEPLRAPDVEPLFNGLRVRHVIALFSPGEHTIAMPAIEVLHPDGTVENVAGDSAVVRVAAVIPDSVRAPRPMPAVAPIARPAPRTPLAVLPVLVLLVVLSAWVAWWRRPRRALAVAGAEAAPPDPPLMRWLAAGERRAVASVAVHRLRRRVAADVPASARAPTVDAWSALLAEARPTWPVAELTDILRALERARFAPLGADDLVELVDRADVAIGRLDRAGAGADAA